MLEGLTHIRMNFEGRGHFINKDSPDVKKKYVITLPVPVTVTN